MLLDGAAAAPRSVADRRTFGFEALLATHGARDAAGATSTRRRRPGFATPPGTTGAPKGVLYTHRSNYLHTLRALQADAIALTGGRLRAGRRADVSCQRLGPAVRGAGGRRQAGAARPPDRRRTAWRS